MSFHTVSKVIGGKEISIETGRMAKQANGAVFISSGGSSVLCTACMSSDAPEGFDFFPLTVHYQEKFYASGKIPGGYIKRESRPSEHAVLTSRLIDRPIRPMFPKDFKNEVQVVATTLAYDSVNQTDVLALMGASAALAISDIPFIEAVSGVRIVYRNGEYLVNPTGDEIEDADLDIIAAGTREGMTMVEGGANQVPEEIMLKALEVAQNAIIEGIDFIEELVKLVNPVKMEVTAPEPKLTPELAAEIREKVYPLIKEANSDADKHRRSANIKKAGKSVLEEMDIDKAHEAYSEIKHLFGDIEQEIVRKQILEEGVRADGRKPDEIRQITIDLDVLKSVHGSALFTRGQTQSLGVITLGSTRDMQFIDSLDKKIEKRFMLHYNFPPFSVGEVKRMGAPGRREIGHGHLAERAISAVLPDLKDFPYTIRMVSEVLESNGSSSMATVCSASLSLMTTGVPIKTAVSGIAMGLIWNKEQGKYVILSDIQGLEDHEGDMDFKVTGSRDGITAFQMDVKTIGITREMMKEAMDQALKGRLYILDKMDAAIKSARTEMSESAPKIEMIRIPEDAIGGVIGSGGKVIKKIMAQTGADIAIEDDGKVMVSGGNANSVEEAISIVEHIANGFKKNEVVEGTVSRVEDYGIFVELIPGQTGLLHKSQMKEKKPPRDIYKIGDKVTVKVLGIDERKRISITLA